MLTTKSGTTLWFLVDTLELYGTVAISVFQSDPSGDLSGLLHRYTYRCSEPRDPFRQLFRMYVDLCEKSLAVYAC